MDGSYTLGDDLGGQSRHRNRQPCGEADMSSLSARLPSNQPLAVKILINNVHLTSDVQTFWSLAAVQRNIKDATLRLLKQSRFTRVSSSYRHVWNSAFRQNSSRTDLAQFESHRIHQGYVNTGTGSRSSTSLLADCLSKSPLRSAVMSGI